MRNMLFIAEWRNPRSGFWVLGHYMVVIKEPCLLYLSGMLLALEAHPAIYREERCSQVNKALS
jgi:uncharacterized membrane protein